jgi:hypothetical protein
VKSRGVTTHLALADTSLAAGGLRTAYAQMAWNNTRLQVPKDQRQAP